MLRSLLAIMMGLACVCFGEAQETTVLQWERLNRIGVLEGEAEYTFGRVVGLKFLSDGQIVVLDALDPHVRIFGPDGRHVASFGSKGQGPGEFQRPVGPMVTDSTISVFDQAQRRMVSFTVDGKHVETTRFATGAAPLQTIEALKGGWWIAQHSFDPRAVLVSERRDPEQWEGKLLLFKDGSATDTLSSFDSGALIWYERQGASFGLYRKAFGDEQLFAVSGDSLGATIDCVRGRIEWWTVTDGGITPVAEKDLDLEPEPLELDAVVDSIADANRHKDVAFITPQYQRRFRNALIDPAGRLWLGVRQDESSSPVYWIVPMDEAATIELELPHGFSPQTFGHGVLAGVWADEFHVNYVDVYRIPDNIMWPDSGKP